MSGNQGRAQISAQYCGLLTYSCHLAVVDLSMMENEHIISRRLACQQLSDTAMVKAEDVVAWLGCIQAQDYAGAKWAIGCRLKAGTDAAIEAQFKAGKILRTHIMRPTWHFVTPADIRWITELTAHRVKAFCVPYHRKLGLDAEVLKRSNGVIKKALKGGKQLTRQELVLVLQQAGIRTDDIRLSFLLIGAELDGLICSGGMNGKQFTYALMEEWVPETKAMKKEEALGELAWRYFRSRGPATAADLAWWSGLTITDAKVGIEVNRSKYEKVDVDGRTYWYSGEVAAGGEVGGLGPAGAKDATEGLGGSIGLEGAGLHVLPAYDEYTVAYTDRELVLHPRHAERGGNGIFKPVIVQDGKIVGTWQRTLKKDTVLIGTHLFKAVSKRALKVAFARYGAFIEKTIVMGTSDKA